MDSSIFIECFGGIKDKRIERTKAHCLLDIIALTLFAIMSGAQTFEEIEQFGELHINWLKQYLNLANGIPSHDTIPKPFQNSMLYA
jgi:predicted transposase YbfD/YdcC